MDRNQLVLSMKMICYSYLRYSACESRSHVLPKIHAVYLEDLAPDLGASLFNVAMRVSEALRTSGIRCEGVNLLLADGEAAGQEIPHVHLHVIPRFEGDGFGFKFDDFYNCIIESF